MRRKCRGAINFFFYFCESAKSEVLFCDLGLAVGHAQHINTFYTSPSCPFKRLNSCESRTTIKHVRLAYYRIKITIWRVIGTNMPGSKII